MRMLHWGEPENRMLVVYQTWCSTASLLVDHDPASTIWRVVAHPIELPARRRKMLAEVQIKQEVE